MKIKKLLLVTLVLLLALTLTLAACVNDDDEDPINPELPKPDRTVTQTKLVTYDGPSLLNTSSKVGVKVENEKLFVYETRVNHARSFTFSYTRDYGQVVVFDFEGKVNVEIEVYGAASVTDVVVRPLSYGITPTVSGNTISFALSYTDNYVVEYKTSSSDVAYKNALHIFANPIETDPVDPDNVPADTLYLGPGVWMADAIPVVGNDQTIYLAGGAVVYGQIRSGSYTNLTIRGRGILSGEIYDRTRDSEFTLPIELQQMNGVTIKDITILDPAGWAVTLYKCQNVNIENLKIITARANGDGISVQACSNVTVKGGFVRTWDDSLVVKNVDNSSTSNITFDGVTVWTDLAQSCEVGYETYGPTMKDITFKNITILHNFHKAAISMHNADNAQISNVTYQNITIEDAQMLGDNQNDGDNDFLIDMTIAYSTEWSKSGGQRGAIKNVTIDNIKVLNMADSIICRMYGEGVNSNIDGVTISNIEIAGKTAKSLADIGLAPGVYTNNITYKSNSSVYGSLKGLPYNLELANETVSKTHHNTIKQRGLEVPDFAILSIDPSYVGKKVDLNDVTVRNTYGSGDTATADWNLGEATVQGGNVAANLIDGNRNTPWTHGDWHGLNNEFVAITFDFATPQTIGMMRIFGKETSNLVTNYNIAIFAKTTPDADNGTEKWTRLIRAADFMISPQSSNYTDVQIRQDSYYGIQLRIYQKQGLMYPTTYELYEVEFYPPSLTSNKPVVDASAYEDVYKIENVVDGDTKTYFESKKGVFPAFFTVDMGQAYAVKYINIHLPPLLLWETRTQEIEIQGSNDGKTFFTVVAKTSYTFDATTGNMVALVLDTPVEMRFIKLIFTSNSTGYGGQISELFVYGE